MGMSLVSFGQKWIGQRLRKTCSCCFNMTMDLWKEYFLLGLKLLIKLINACYFLQFWNLIVQNGNLGFKAERWKLGFQSWEILDCQGTSYTSWFQTILDSSSAQGSLVLLVNLSEVTYYLKVISETLVVPSNKSSL